MKKLTNTQRCAKCIHKIVCKYKGAYDGLEWLGDRCKYYKPREKKERGAIFKTKYNLGQEVFYGDKYERKKGEIIAIYFDGTFNNIPKYEIEYNGNVWAEDDINDKE